MLSKRFQPCQMCGHNTYIIRWVESSRTNMYGNTSCRESMQPCQICGLASCKDLFPVQVPPKPFFIGSTDLCCKLISWLSARPYFSPFPLPLANYRGRPCVHTSKFAQELLWGDRFCVRRYVEQAGRNGGEEWRSSFLFSSQLVLLFLPVSCLNISVVGKS